MTVRYRKITSRHFGTDAERSALVGKETSTSSRRGRRRLVSLTYNFSRASRTPPLDASARVTVTKRRAVSALRCPVPTAPRLVPFILHRIFLPSARGVPQPQALPSSTAISVSHWCRTMVVEGGSSRACLSGAVVEWRGTR